MEEGKEEKIIEDLLAVFNSHQVSAAESGLIVASLLAQIFWNVLDEEGIEEMATILMEAITGAVIESLQMRCN